MSTEKLKFAIYGSHAGKQTEKTVEAARVLGRAIAERGHILITGGGAGVAYEAAQAAAEAQGEVIGHSFARSQEEHVALGLPMGAFTSLKFVPESYELAENVEARRLYRNTTTAASADAAIVISGQWGTTNEATNIEHLGKPLGVVIGTGGIAEQLPRLIEGIPSKRIPILVASSDPLEILDRLELHLKDRI